MVLTVDDQQSVESNEMSDDDVWFKSIIRTSRLAK